MAGAYATLMLGAWPEPFGLVAIESMATGTPVIARRAGANTETVQHGLSGYLVDDIDEAVLAVDRVSRLDRDLVSKYARENFSDGRMVDRYEETYRAVVSAADTAGVEPLHLVPTTPTDDDSQARLPADDRSRRGEAG
jgi:glycosyltransferase involved in cell wall biosynthesis